MLSNNPIHWANIMNEDEKKELTGSPEFREWLIGVLQDNNTTTTVTFKKKDGTIRKMRCTRNPSLIPEEFHPKNESVESASALRVFDLDKNEWRSFVLENVMSVDYVF